MQDVDEESIVFLIAQSIVIAMANQSRLAHSSWGNQDEVIAIGDDFLYLLRLSLTVTEVLWLYLAYYYKGVLDSCHIPIYDTFPVAKIRLLSQLYKFYNRNSIKNHLNKDSSA